MHSATFVPSVLLVVAGMHTKGKQHTGGISAVAASSQSVKALFQSHAKLSESQIGAEACWSFFVAKRNIVFFTSNHTMKLFFMIYPNYNIAILPASDTL